MNVHQLLESLEKLIEERKLEIATKLAEGGVADWPAYKGQVGRYKELTEIGIEFREQLKQMEKKDDE